MYLIAKYSRSASGKNLEWFYNKIIIKTKLLELIEIMTKLKNEKNKYNYIG